MTLLIVILCLFIGFIAWFFYEFASHEIGKCEHKHFAEYRSRKIKQCIDCGIEVDIDATNW